MLSHPLVKSAIVSPIASAAGYVAGGTTAGLLGGESFGTVFGNSFDGIGQSMAMGSAMGVGTTMGAMYTSGLNPFSNRALAARARVQYYAKSSLQLGRRMYKEYKVGVDGIKEFRLPNYKK